MDVLNSGDCEKDHYICYGLFSCIVDLKSQKSDNFVLQGLLCVHKLI